MSIGTVSASVGLATGMDISGTVDALMEIESKSRDNLETRNDKLMEEQYAITELAALVASTMYAAENFGKETTFEERELTSSNESVLKATKVGTIRDGTYVFTPIQMAQNHQMLSQGFEHDGEALGGGEVKIRFGDDVSRDMSLDALNGGNGIQRGYIRITDRSGASEQIDLSAALTVQDVLDAINSATNINVTAVVDGDQFQLIDQTGQDKSNLRVQEVGGQATAATLGLAGIDVAESEVTGNDVVNLNSKTPLSLLNDGLGVERNRVVSDFDYLLHDGTVGKIDFAKLVSGKDDEGNAIKENKLETTVGDVLLTIEQQSGGKLTAKIDGDRLVFTDNTTGGEGSRFAVAAINDSKSLYGLGIEDAVTEENTVTGRKIIGGLNSVLLSSLNGGKGFAEMGTLDEGLEQVEVTLGNVNGSLQVNFEQSDIESLATLGDVVELINSGVEAAEQASGNSLGVRARVNQSKTGIELYNLNNGTDGGGTLFVSEKGDFLTSLGLVALDEETGLKTATSSDGIIGSGNLNLKTVSTETRLEDYNGGAGVRLGIAYITDSNGLRSTLNVKKEMETIGDVIRAINNLQANVYAEINEAGDGIMITDMAGGEKTMTLAGDGITNAAADLKLIGQGSVDENTLEQVFNATTSITITMDEDESLDDLRQKINELDVGIYASTFIDGSSSPYRLSLSSQRSGQAGKMVVDMSQLGIKLNETAQAQDAVMIYGARSSTGDNVLVTSSTNHFDSIISGISFDMKQANGETVTIGTNHTYTDLKASMITFVKNYNTFREGLDNYTYFDTSSGKGSILTMDSTALQMESSMADIITKTYYGNGPINSLVEIGIDIDDKGMLTFDQPKLQEWIDNDPEAVKNFFLGINEDPEEEDKEVSGPEGSIVDYQRNHGIDPNDLSLKNGFYAALKTMINSLTETDVSITAKRFTALQDQIEDNTERIEWMDGLLDKKRDRLYMEFYRMELAVSRIQSNMSSISQIQALVDANNSSE